MLFSSIQSLKEKIELFNLNTEEQKRWKKFYNINSKKDYYDLSI